MYAQICPQHPDEFVQAVVVNDDGLLSYTCDRAGHVTAGDFVWSGVAESNATESISGLAAELSLDTALPAAIAQYPGKWIEYGVVEAAYAQANPEEFAHLIQEHGHRAIKPSKYTISKYLASILAFSAATAPSPSTLDRQPGAGTTSGRFRGGPRTRRWSGRRRIKSLSQEPGSTPAMCPAPKIRAKRSTSENRSSSPRQ